MGMMSSAVYNLLGQREFLRPRSPQKPSFPRKRESTAQSASLFQAVAIHRITCELGSGLTIRDLSVGGI
jgi:hypothetical protein